MCIQELWPKTKQGKNKYINYLGVGRRTKERKESEKEKKQQKTKGSPKLIKEEAIKQASKATDFDITNKR